MYSEEQVRELLSKIPDPEVPVISIVELGIVRAIALQGKSVEVSITPTYSGCPAMKMIEDSIQESLQQAGFEQISVKTIYSPAWSTDWISSETREKLRAYGIAPPLSLLEDNLVRVGKKGAIKCPRCNSANTRLQSEFGATACKALYTCNDCKEPFEYFKAY